MREEFSKFIRECQLFNLNDKLLVAVSGGADSVALCYLLNSLKINFIITHCNFQLRGQESDKDERFVVELGNQLSVKVFVKRFETEVEAAKMKKSIQMTARELRYQWFSELKNIESCQYIATAHHTNDSLETILLNLTRGTGIAGLHGIKVKSGDIIRPLLFASKNQILEFIKDEHIAFREDSSNSINKYYRNLIRNKVVPELKSINPGLEHTLSVFIEKISSAEEILNGEIQKFKSSYLTKIGENTVLKIDGLKNEPGLLLKLSSVLEEYHFTFQQCKLILTSVEKQSGKVFITETHKLVKDRKNFIITAIKDPLIDSFSIEKETKTFVTPDFSLNFKIVEKNEFELRKDKKIAQLDYDRLVFPLTLRRWSHGDFFYPLGMNKKKKLSDFFIDSKIPLSDKERKMVLLSEDKIVWVAGERVDDRFKIVPGTKKILSIELENQGIELF